MKDKDVTQSGDGMRNRDELLQAYFDGEASAEDIKFVRQEFETSGRSADAELEVLRVVRKEFREFFKQETTAAGRLDIWNAIEADITSTMPKRSVVHRVREFFDSLGVPPMLISARGSALVGAFAVGGLLYSGLLTEEATQPNASIEKNTVAYVPSDSVRSTQTEIPMVSFTSTEGGTSVRSELASRSPFYEAKRQRAPFLRDSHSSIDTNQLISSDGISEGLRTDGLDIEWVKSKRPFKIVSSSGRKAPPVIWVARGNR